VFSHEQFHFIAEVGQEFKYGSYFGWYFITLAMRVFEGQLNEFRTLSCAVSNSVFIAVIHTKF